MKPAWTPHFTVAHKTRGSLPTDEVASKLIYRASRSFDKDGWNVREWFAPRNQFAIIVQQALRRLSISNRMDRQRYTKLRTLPDELLNETMFRNLAHARVVFAAWATDHNTERAHSALDHQTPADYARTLITAIARSAARNESAARRAIAQPAPIGINTNRVPLAAA